MELELASSTWSGGGTNPIRGLPARRPRLVSCTAGPPTNEKAIRLWTDDYYIVVTSEPSPPRALEQVQYTVVVRDKENRTPIDGGEGLIIQLITDPLQPFELDLEVAALARHVREDAQLAHRSASHSLQLAPKGSQPATEPSEGNAEVVQRLRIVLVAQTRARLLHLFEQIEADKASCRCGGMMKPANQTSMVYRRGRLNSSPPATPRPPSGTAARTGR